MKILGFLDPPASSGIVAVAYMAGDPASQADATEIVAWFGDGLKAGTNVIHAEAVDANLLGRHQYVAIIAAVGVPSEPVMQVVKTLGVPCITGDLSLVQAGRCVLAVRSDPRVEIVLNHSVAAWAGINFATAFRMLVHEI